jgi:hypothetical protein
MTEYKVSLSPHPTHWTQRDDIAALWDGGINIIVVSGSESHAKSRALAVLPWRLCTLFNVEVTTCN